MDSIPNLSAAASNVMMRDPRDLKPHPNNPRTHSKTQINALKRSISRFGFPNPVLVDTDDRIIAGHGRVDAAKALGLVAVPTLPIDWMSEAEKRAYIIADNALAQQAGWDKALLSLELGTIAQLDPDLDLTLTGFSIDDIELFQDLGRKRKKAKETADSEAVESDAPVLTRTGDLWTIGEHQLLCGDARDRKALRTLLGRRKADIIITDPPYNVAVNGHVSGLGKHQHREFVMASGEMSREAFRTFLGEILSNLASASRPGALSYIFMDWRHIADLLDAGDRSYEQLVNLAVWVKSNGGMGSLYRSRHELVAIFRRAGRGHLNNVELGSNGRYRTNVWEYAGANSFGKDRNEALAMHPTVKPVEMISDAILDVTRENDLVLDVFAGSGTTLLAAHDTGRQARLMEIDPVYCDLILKRAQGAGLAITLGDQTMTQVQAVRQGDTA